MSKQQVLRCADWLRTYLRQNGPAPRRQVIAAAIAAGFPEWLVDKAASRYVDVVKNRVGTSSTWELPGPLRILSASEIVTTAVATPWPTFPHCPGCQEKLWAITFDRHPQDVRGPLLLPNGDGTCPHCNLVLYTTPAAADAMANLVRSMR